MRNKKILITGADGFIGSHLVETLLKNQNEVIALSMYNSFNNWGWLEGIKNNRLEVTSGDIRDYNFCKKISNNVDVIFHLAALIAIPYSYHSPRSYIDTNVIGTLNLCEALKENKLERLINLSTSEVYGTAKYVPIDENHPLQPQSPYSASKIGAESIAMSYYNSFDLPITTVRPFNVYGPRQSARAIIPSLIIQMISNKEFLDVGNLSPTRDYTFVEDTCNGLIGISNEVSLIGKIINLGSETEISIEEIINKLKFILGSNIKTKIDKQRIRPDKSEVERLLSDTTLLKNHTKYKPKYNFDEGLNITVEWFSKKENLQLYKSNIYNI